MLRIRYTNKSSVFYHKGIRKRDAADVIKRHLQLWGRETVKENGERITRTVPKDTLVAEWQDGDVWKDDAPVEAIPIP